MSEKTSKENIARKQMYREILIFRFFVDGNCSSSYALASWAI
jgi:hypothetical protein